MNASYPMLPESGERIVYVLPVQVADLQDDIRANLPGVDVVYAVHRDTGERLALVADRKLAFALARQHDMAPVNAH